VTRRAATLAPFLKFIEDAGDGGWSPAGEILHAPQMHLSWTPGHIQNSVFFKVYNAYVRKGCQFTSGLRTISDLSPVAIVFLFPAFNSNIYSKYTVFFCGFQVLYSILMYVEISLKENTSMKGCYVVVIRQIVDHDRKKFTTY
jgi:hypothetical protein